MEMLSILSDHSVCNVALAPIGHGWRRIVSLPNEHINFLAQVFQRALVDRRQEDGASSRLLRLWHGHVHLELRAVDFLVERRVGRHLVLLRCETVVDLVNTFPLHLHVFLHIVNFFFRFLGHQAPVIRLLSGRCLFDVVRVLNPGRRSKLVFYGLGCHSAATLFLHLLGSFVPFW